MLTVTLYGPPASGKSRTIHRAVQILTARKVRAKSNEEAFDTPSALELAGVKVMFTSSQFPPGNTPHTKGPHGLSFSIRGAGPRDAATAAVREAMRAL